MPTHLIYEAWKNTGKIIYNTKDSKGNEVKREIHFVDPRTHKDIEAHNGYCYLCGEQMEYGMKLKKIFSNVFTDWNAGKHRTATHVCEACCFTILQSPQKNSLRMFSHVANKDKLHLTNRVELRQYLTEPPKPPFVINLAVSQKKHIAFKSEVNYSKDVFTVMYEEMPVLVNRQEFIKLLNLIEHFLYGFTKTEITTGQYNQKRILDFGIEEWQAFEDRVKEYRGKPLLDVVMFVAQKIENKEELECFTVSELKMNMQQQQRSLSTQSIAVETEKEGHKALICGGKSNDSPKSVQNEQLQLELF